jgi:hypothetical protein
MLCPFVHRLRAANCHLQDKPKLMFMARIVVYMPLVVSIVSAWPVKDSKLHQTNPQNWTWIPADPKHVWDQGSPGIPQSLKSYRNTYLNEGLNSLIPAPHGEHMEVYRGGWHCHTAGKWEHHFEVHSPNLLQWMDAQVQPCSLHCPPLSTQKHKAKVSIDLNITGTLRKCCFFMLCIVNIPQKTRDWNLVIPQHQG